MNPSQPQTQTPTSGFTPKWRHFSPLTRVWVQNPFDHDIVYQVADEYNRPFKYRLPAGKVSELPGGSIATLGVKQIVDQLIASSKADEMHMHDPEVRAKHEKDIILRIKETKPQAGVDAAGEVDLSVKSNEVPDAPVAVAKEPETPFPGLNDQALPEPVLAPLPDAAKAGLDDIVGASLPSSDSIAAPNNANSSAEG